ncbi:MAG: dTMP kinase [Candidatus Abyssobacteria bacterium SURF_5]|uniref:Thymidylate kinase n=1 Tax=Abyssobacteria bacterium (strain SURF_5) TaxID=2093360 RepID=A0A3A4NN17_ABYX5|nr:MAG: dTMP kinase [Candidatus Abyssubacteria bacterium SURF_5]
MGAKFITIEGVEGSGKTTQAALLADYLRRQGIGLVETREPGGTEVGEQVRQILLSPLSAGLAPMAELLLFLAARAQLVKEVIVPALQSGKWVICDRFFDATLAYQGHGRGIDGKIIRKLNEHATSGLKPDVTFLLDLDIEVGIRRAVSAKREFTGSRGGDRLEQEDKEFHRRVREGYLELARPEPDRVKIIPVSGSIEHVHKIIVSLIEPFLVKVQ